MELIFARSTLARLGNARAGDEEMGAELTGFGAGGVGAGAVTVTEVAVAVVHGTTLGVFSVFTGAEVGAACFSFLSSTVLGGVGGGGEKRDQGYHSVLEGLLQVQDFQCEPYFTPVRELKWFQ